MKTCSKCGETKPLDCFGVSKNHKNGVNPWCKGCVNASGKRWKARNPERVLEKAREYHHANRDVCLAKGAAWRARSVEHRKQYRKDRRAENLIDVRRRQALKLARIPAWADPTKIKAIYKEAAAMRALGIDVHVDHIIPLQAKNASGLHTHDNLQLLLASDNIAKGNRMSETT